ncbi:MAG TPA: hypothetical protein DCY89_06405, partial [Gammaproteobacteria bacterium]|nr:hypothetical protein [Gammaproteobacteria bacterium]
AEFETLAGQIDLQMAALARREQELFHQMDLGLPQLAAEGQVNQARRATAEATAALVAQMERLVALNPLLFDPATQERLAQFKSGMARLSEVADTGAQRINSALGTAMERLFMDLGSGAMSAADAFRGFLRTVVAEIQAVIARNLAQSLLRSLFGDGQGGGGAGGAGGLG